MCEVPLNSALLPHRGLADAISLDQIFALLSLHDCCAVMAAREEIQTLTANRLRKMCPGKDYRFSSTGL
jgi:hypothetical protein